MKEADYQRKIIKKLESEGFYVLKLISTNKNGIPDLIALKPHQVLFYEVKTPTGETSPLQDYRIKELRMKGFLVKTGSEYK